MDAPARRIVRTWVGQFTIVRGQPQEQGPCLGLFPAKRADGEAVDLFILAEPALPGSEAFSRQLIDAVAELFQREHLSITGGLVRALRAAHQTLLDWNRRSLREHQVGAGVSCLAVRNGLAYLAQAGPSLAYIWTGDSLEQIKPELEDAVRPLGMGERIYPEFHRIELKDGMMIILCSPSLSDVLDLAALTEVLKRGSEEAMMELYALTRHMSDFSLLLLAAIAESVPVVETAPPVEPAAASPRSQYGTAEVSEEAPLTPSPPSAASPDQGESAAEADLAQRLRRFFGVEEDSEAPERLPQQERIVLADSGPVSASEVRRPPPIRREVQPLPPIDFEPNYWQVLIGRLARMGWPALLFLAFIVIGLLAGAWCLVL